MVTRIVMGLVIGLVSGLVFVTGVAEAAPETNTSSTEQQDNQVSIGGFDLLTETAPNCRYGVSAWEDKFLSELRVGLIQNFGPFAPENLQEGVEYAGLVSIYQKKLRDSTGRLIERFDDYDMHPTFDELGRTIDANPGRLWIVGNETDRALHQGDTEAHVLAKAYYDVYHFIKQRDPSAQIAPTALVGVTPARLQYLDMVWETYEREYGNTMPVDVWTFHAYMFAEVYADGRWSNAGKALGTDISLAILDADGDASLCPLDNYYCKSEHDSVEIFAQQVVAMRRWMKEHGEQDKPLVLTEFGLLYQYQVINGECTVKDENGQCFTPQRSADYMVKAYEWLENATDPDLGYALDSNRLVQQWMWFSMPYPHERAVWIPSLWAPVDMSTLSIVGQTHITEINKRPLERNLVFDPADSPFSGTATLGQPTTITASFYNNGNATIENPVPVTFYADEAMTKVIGTTTVRGGVNGCARRGYEVSVTWDDNLAPGVHKYWVAIDAADTIQEFNESDNVAQGEVFIASNSVYLPSMLK